MKNRILLTCLIVIALAAGSVYAADLPNPFKDPKVGDWVVHQVRDDVKMKQTIISVSAQQVIIEIETFKDGESVNTLTRENKRIYEPDLTLLGIKEGGPEPKITQEVLTIKGKKLKCTVIEQVRDGVTAKTWISEDIPVNGLVKVEISDGDKTHTGSMEIIDWGRGK